MYVTIVGGENMYSFFNWKDKKKHIIILLLFTMIFLTGCQSYVDEIEYLESENEELILENEKLQNEIDELKEEFENYKELMEPYEKLHKSKESAQKEIEELNFLENKSDALIKIQNAKSIDEVNNNLDEIRKLDADIKNKHIAESKIQINGFTYLSDEKKSELIDNISEKNNTSDMDKIVSSANEENQELAKIAKEKEEAERKEQEAKRAAQASTKSKSGNKKSAGSSQVGSKQQGQVLITRTGKKYHKRACGNGTYFPASLSEAQSRGLTPCAKCY